MSSVTEHAPMTVSSSANMPAPTSSSAAITTTNSDDGKEENLKKRLRQALQVIKKREPLEHTYKHLLMNGVVTPRKPTLPKDRLYRKVGGRLRERVETFMRATDGGDPLDRLSSRSHIEEDAMRASFTLRECKKHEQDSLLVATLAALPRCNNGMDDATNRQRLEGIAMGLQSRKRKARITIKAVQSPNSLVAKLSANGGGDSSKEQQRADLQKQQAELDRQRAQQRTQERLRKRREEEDRIRAEERQEEEDRRARMRETPRQALQRIYQPIFKVLWDMEFQNLGGTNPFRIPIDKDNCAQMGAPDYCDIVQTPMNLTWIDEKVKHMEYESLQAFFADVELMLTNALLYNSDPNNDYHLAAKEMKRRYKKMAKAVVQKLQQRQQSQS